MSDHITLEVSDHVATLTLNRPEARNALSTEMRNGLAEYTAQLEFDDAVRCVVLRGAGGHFMAGGDIKGFKTRQGLSPAERKREVLKGLSQLHFAIYRLRRMPKPVLASVQGAAAGAGMSLMCACDLTIAAEDAFFYFGYTNIGLSPDGSSTWFLPRLLGLRRTLELTLLPERMDARTALDWGLVNRVVPAERLESATRELALRLASGPTYAYGRAKALLDASFNNSMETQLELEGHAIGDCMTTADHEEGVNAFLEKRPPRFQGR
jgi:2-(1,2-epoxy-1,2-dihydrophenyl)acetyl-CoA isomerase